MLTILKNRFSKLLIISRDRKSGWLLPLLSFVVTIAILAYMIYRQKEVLLNFDWEFYPIPLLSSFLFFSLDLLLVAVIWGWIMNTFGKRLSYRKHVKYYYISNIAKRIPGTVWYIAGRAQLYKRDGLDFKLTTLASGVEYGISILSGILVCLLFAVPITFYFQLNILVFVGLFLVGVLLLHPRFVELIFRLLKVDLINFNYKNVILWTLAYSLVWILGGSVFYVIANIIANIPLQYLGYFIGSWSLVGVTSSLLLLSPSNFGITEIGLSLLLSRILPSPIAVIITIVTRLMTTIFEIIWAAVCLWLNNKEKRD